MKFLLTLVIAAASTLLSTPAAAEEESEAQFAARGTRPRPREIWDAEGFDPRESLGIFVGVRRFSPDSNLAEIRWAVDDAIDLAYLFSLELGLISTTRVHLLLAGEPEKDPTRLRKRQLEASGASIEVATFENLRDAIHRKTSMAGPRGMLVISIATHGYSHNSFHHLMAADNKLEHLDKDGATLTAQSIIDQVTSTDTQTRRSVLLLDACQARYKARGRDPHSAVSENLIEAMKNVHGEIVISAARIGGFAFEDGYANGVFSGAIFDGLSRCAAPTDARKFVTIETLIDYVDQAVRAWTKDLAGEGAWRPGIARRGGGTIWNLPLKFCETRQPWFRRHLVLPPEGAPAGTLWEGDRTAMRFRLIPAGSFMHGSQQQGSSDQAKRVDILRSYWIAETEVTRSKWLSLMGYLPPGNERKCRECPVTNVDWFEALRFTNRMSIQAKFEPCFNIECEEMSETGSQKCWSAKLVKTGCFGYRLPLEEEWEYAARAGSQDNYWFGPSDDDLEKYGWFEKNSGGSVHPVRAKQKANGWNLYGIHGNAGEWTLSTWISDETVTELEPAAPHFTDVGAERRVVRGGYFGSLAERTRSSFRDAAYPDRGSRGFGFRVLLPASLALDDSLRVLQDPSSLESQE